MTTKQVNLRFNEEEIKKLEEIAERHNLPKTGKQEAYNFLIRETISAIHLSNPAEKAQFMQKYAADVGSQALVSSIPQLNWAHTISELERLGLTPALFNRDWLPLVESTQKIGFDIRGDVEEIFLRATKVAAIIDVHNCVSAKSEAVRQAAVKDILDRGGFKAENKILMELNQMSDEEVDNDIKRILLELGIAQVDVA